MPDIQQQTADIIRTHYFERAWLGDGCGCNSWRGEFEEWQSHVAEVLVSELGLTDRLGMTYSEINNSTEWVADA